MEVAHTLSHRGPLPATQPKPTLRVNVNVHIRSPSFPFCSRDTPFLA